MNNVLSILGLCQKAGRLTTGETMVEQGLKDKTICLVIVSEDASDNTKKKFTNMCTYRNIPLIFFSDRYTLGKALGKEYRVTIGIFDEGFANNIKSKIGENLK